MKRTHLQFLLIALSIAYGTSLALLHGHAATLVAVIGAGLLAIGWVGVGALYRQDRERNRQRG